MTDLPQFLVVDGHNMIHAWQDLAGLHRQRTELAREELVKWLTHYQDASDVRVVVVFDGRGQRRISSTGGGSEIQVLYSRDGQTADEVIERLVVKYAAKYEMRVATDDHMEQLTVETFGAIAISSELLRLELEQAEAEIGAKIRRHNKR